MNPCAATFTPGPSSPEPSIGDDNHHAEKHRRIPTCPRSWRRKENVRPVKPDALDPDNYDAMFPSLSTSNPHPIPLSGHSRQSSCMKNRKKRKAQKLSTENEEINNTTVVPSPEAAGSPVSDKPEHTTVRCTTVGKDDSEVLSPGLPGFVVHALPESPHATQKQCKGPEPLSLPPPCVPKSESMALVPVTHHMPPTPRPDHEMPVQPDSALVTYSTEPLPPQNDVLQQSLPLPQPQWYPNVITPAPVAPVPVYYYPQQYAPYPAVYVTMPPVAWQPAFTQPIQTWPVPPAQHLASWPQQLQDTSTPGPQLQIQSRASSRGASHRTKGSRASSQVKRRSMDYKQSQLTVNQPGIPRSASTAGYTTQVEVLKSKYRAKSSSPRRPPPKYQVIDNQGDQSCQSRITLKMTRVKAAGEHKEPNGTNDNEQVFRQHLQQKFEGEEAFKKTLGLETGQTSQCDQVRSIVSVKDLKTSQLESPIPKDQYYLHNTPPSVEYSPPIPLCGPPMNAPKAPASQRRVTQGSITLPQPPSVPSPAESGGWSQSKRWMSQETKERAAFQKMLINLHYMGADKSPFVPQSPAELTAFKLETAESEKLKLIQEMDKRLAKVNGKTLSTQKGKKVQSLVNLLGGKQLRDKLSPVFSAVHCFNKELPTEDEFRVDWPSLAELKEEGDKRASRYGRYFPLPRLNMIATRFSGEDRDQAYNPDGSIRWEKKAVKLGAREIIPVTADSEAYTITPVVELHQDELPVPLQLIIKHIDGSQGESQEEDKDQGDK
ncbi:hypothetical protein G7Z17_g10383 [Cylindrodendrum hubeiense]|uniref:Uncharacterized protein n=1 Tax=Cylindrodendrum hubeiense TaxID=595255 RepID=A0A9P5H621_9HYPO|nr:hypothetical protein G7Z17_g10383 [Cylindrodendrum hubeiense]